MSPSNLGVFVFAKRTAAAGRAGGRSATTDKPCGSRLARQGLWNAYTMSVAQGSTKWQTEACVTAWFLQRKQWQQMWLAGATGGNSRQDRKKAHMRAEMRSYPSVCACMQTQTHNVPVKRKGVNCLSQHQYVTPAIK